MQLYSTFGAFLVAFTMVHGAPLLVERHPARAGNMTANANPSAPGSNFRVGGDGFKAGMMQGVENDGPSVEVNASDDAPNEGEPAKRSDGIKSGSSGSSGTSSSVKPQAKAPAGGSSTAATGVTDAALSSIEGIFGRDSKKTGTSGTSEASSGGKVPSSPPAGGSTVTGAVSGRDQAPTQQAAGNGVSETGNGGSTGKPPGGQPNGGTSGPSRNSGSGGSGGSRSGPPQQPAEGASLKREPLSAKPSNVKVGSQTQNVDTKTDNNTSQVPGPATGVQSSSTANKMSTEGLTNSQKATRRAAVGGRVTIKARAERNDSSESSPSNTDKSPSGSSTSSNSGTGQSPNDQAPSTKKPTSSSSSPAGGLKVVPLGNTALSGSTAKVPAQGTQG